MAIQRTLTLDKERLHQTILSGFSNPIDKAFYYTFFDQRSSDLILRIKRVAAAALVWTALFSILLPLLAAFTLVPWTAALGTVTLVNFCAYRTILVVEHVDPLRKKAQTLIETNRLTELFSIVLETDADKRTKRLAEITSKLPSCNAEKERALVNLVNWFETYSSFLLLQGKAEEAEECINHILQLYKNTGEPLYQGPFQEERFTIVIIAYLEKQEFTKALQLLENIQIRFGETVRLSNILEELRNELSQVHVQGPSGDLTATLSRLKDLDERGIPTKNIQDFIQSFLQEQEPLTPHDVRHDEITEEEQAAFQEFVTITLEQQNYAALLNPETRVGAVTLGRLAGRASAPLFTIIEPHIKTLINKGHFSAAYALIQAISREDIYSSLRYRLQVSRLAHKVRAVERSCKERVPALALWNLHAYAADNDQVVPDEIPYCTSEGRQFSIHSDT